MNDALMSAFFDELQAMDKEASVAGKVLGKGKDLLTYLAKHPEVVAAAAAYPVFHHAVVPFIKQQARGASESVYRWSSDR